MSGYYEETYNVYRENCMTANKPHACSACGISIPKGGRYYRVAWVCDGAADGVKRCLACQVTHEHLRELCKQGEQWPDETLSCGLNYEDEWDTEPPPEIAALAFWRYGEPLPQTKPCEAKLYENMFPPVWRNSNAYMRGVDRCAVGVWDFHAKEACS